jgi:phosphoserine phosphatase RsbU/P
MVEPMKEAVAPMTGLTVTDKLRLLLDITKKISSSLNLQEVLNLVMDTLDSLIPYDAAGIYVIRCDKRRFGGDETAESVCVFHTEAVRGYDIDELKDLRLKMGEGIIGHVAITGEPVISPDVRDDPHYVNARAETRSEMVAPITSNNEVVGVFDL